MVYIGLPEGILLNEEEINKICESLFSTIKRELPEDYWTVAVISTVFEECSEKIKGKKLQL